MQLAELRDVTTKRKQRRRLVKKVAMFQELTAQGDKVVKQNPRFSSCPSVVIFIILENLFRL